MTSCVQIEEQDARSLTQRVFLLAAVLGSEALVASVFLDGATLSRKPGLLIRLIHDWGAWAVRFAIGFAAVFTTFAWLKHHAALTALSSRVARARISRAWLAVHLIGAVVFAALSAVLYGAAPAAIPDDLIAGLWMLAGLSVMVSAALAFLPPDLWADLRRATGKLWLFASGAAFAACILGTYSRALWAPTTRLTFDLVKLILRFFFHDIVVQPAVMRIGTQRFSALVSPECSGLEGIGLMLIFGVVWLILFRHDTRFPQSLLLLPGAILVLFLLNSVRIAAFILIGHAGAKEIARRGFHSQAGWIAFNFVAFGFSLCARRVTWFSKNRPAPAADAGISYNPAAAFLVPFLTILAARMISRAASGSFEWTYPLGFFAAATALWMLRRNYKDLPRKFGWEAPVCGALVFVLWVALDRFSGAAASRMPAPLAAAPWAVRDSWIALRVLSAVVTVPIAEELAFRGFLLRRLIAPDFEMIPLQTWTWFSLLASSIAFGAMHGDRWLAGSIAGLLYALVATRRGQLSEAIVAHATTNALLAAYVLILQKWQFW